MQPKKIGGRYVPPHKRDTLAVTSNEALTSLPPDAPFQQAMWDALQRTLTGAVNKVSRTNLKQVAVELFRENIVRGRGLLTRALIRAQQADPDLTPVFAALTAVINKEFPAIGMLLTKRLILLWRKLYRRRQYDAVAHVNRFLSQLYCFDVVDEDLVMELILVHLLNPRRSDQDVDLAMLTFKEVFRLMLQRSPREFHENLFEPLRESLLVEGDASALSVRSQAVVESALKEVQEWQKQRLQLPAVSPELQVVSPADQVTHHVEFDAELNEDANLDVFAYDSKFEEHEAQYETARRAILGADWEEQLLAAVENAAEAELDAESAEGARQQQQQQQPSLGDASAEASRESESKVQAILTQEEERKIKEEVYLMIRSSLRADEIAHKILKKLRHGTERMVCAMVLDTCCQEVTYRKIFALVGEKLCRSNAFLQHVFADVFSERYRKADQLAERQIDHVGQFWAHLLASESMSWTSLKCLRVLESDASQRLMVQSLLQCLARAMGISRLASRLEKDAELTPHLRGLFPDTQDLNVLQLVVDLYESMGVGPLAARARRQFEDIRRARADDLSRKRERTDYAD